MHNPLRSEADAFRWVMAIGAGAATVIVLTLLTRPAVGVAWAALLVGFGAGTAYGGLRGALPRSVATTSGRDGKYRILVLANETAAGDALLDQVRIRCGGRDCRILVVTPAPDLGEAAELARQRMELSLIALGELGLKARGEIGVADPNLAIEDALRVFAADEIVVSTHPPPRSRWLERGVVERARERFDLPITHVIDDPAAERAVRR